MADILEFPRLRTMPADPMRLSDGQSAAILFFTGVRYERHAETDRSQAAMDGLGPVSGGGGAVPPQKRRRRG
jgi:hypothetical protein